MLFYRSACKGFSILANKLKEGEEYVSDEQGIRISVPNQGRRTTQEFAVGLALLERTADVVECGEDVFFITSIVHCFPSGVSSAEPVLLDFAVEAMDDSFKVRASCGHVLCNNSKRRHGPKDLER